MTAERIDVADWPLTVSVGPGYYGLRIDTDHGSEVRYVEIGPGWICRSDTEPMRALHDGARCEEAA